MYHFLVLQSIQRNQQLRARIIALKSFFVHMRKRMETRGPPVSFFGTETFVQKIFMSSEFILKQTGASKSLNGLLFYIFRHHETVSKLSFLPEIRFSQNISAADCRL